MTDIEAPAPPEDGASKLPYIANADLVVAAEVALSLGKALLLTGEPGVGKTTFANHLAETLAPRWLGLDHALPLEVFSTKSTSAATDLFYRFDSLRRFHANYDSQMSKDNRDYLTFEALGRAILNTLPWSQVSHIVREPQDHPSAIVRSVVLIDEIDKAPRDFPNDLLNEIEQFSFRIPELAKDKRVVEVGIADNAYRPLVVLTSNSEKNLPAAFLRRCVFHHIQFPQAEIELKKHLADIVKAHLAQAVGTVANDAISFFYKLRQARDIEKPPATAELVDWVDELIRRAAINGVDPVSGRLTALDHDLVRGTLGVLAKGQRDLDTARRILSDFYTAKD